ncbi:MAG TPA: tRNA (guanosine(46)-N7)-methyltransferase TrmB [Oculatellaceae cyanobacterium]
MKAHTNDQPRRGFFCGRHGHPLRPYHAQLFDTQLPPLRLDLSQPAPDDSRTLFSVPVNDIMIEIGFGEGDHLISEAKRQPGVGFIGCDPYRLGVAKTVDAIADSQLQNVKLHPSDAWELLEWLPDATVGGVYLLYPDPWPKRKHHGRRFLQEDTLTAFARILRVGALLRLATDVEDYGEWMFRCGSRSTSFESIRNTESQRTPWSSFPGTRYEARAKRQGRTPRYLEFVRV